MPETVYVNSVQPRSKLDPETRFEVRMRLRSEDEVLRRGLIEGELFKHDELFEDLR